MTATTVLIIEDEAEIRRFLSVTLTMSGFKLIEASTAHDGQRQLVMQKPDLMILDLGLPDQDGQDFISAVREWSQVPIIVLSARNQEAEKIKALESGADDYLTKPFAAGELLARINVALRHAHRLSSGEAIYEINGLKIDLAARRVTLENSDIHLSPIEYKLLSLLVRNAGKVLTHTQLLKEIWGKHASAQHAYLRIHAQHLREKLNDDAMNPRFIFTEPGVGYRFAM